MKIYSAFFLITLIISSTFAAAQDVEVELFRIRQVAEQDANNDTNKILWFSAGACAFTSIPVLMFGGCLVGESIKPDNPGVFIVSIGDGAAAGCCIGTLISLISPLWIYTYQSQPPAERFLGKSPEYVSAYTDFYISRTKSIRRKSALVGAASAFLLISVAAGIADSAGILD